MVGAFILPSTQMKTSCLTLLPLFTTISISFASSLENEAGSFAADQDRIHKDVLDQVGFSLRAGIDPMTVVTELEGIRPVSGDVSVVSDKASSHGRGAIYLGEEMLLPGTTVGLFRALLVRKDVLYKWIDDGTMAENVWQDFWKYYSVEFTSESNEDEKITGTTTSWMAIPVGDVDKGPDDATWWIQGPISDDRFEEALTSLNAKVLVDWRRLAAGDKGQLYLFNAHIINEPSAGGGVDMDGELLHEEEKENISHLHGSGCSDGLMYCGAVFEAKSSKNIHPGEQLLWCYGKGYARRYPVSQMCLHDDANE
mmetsp:Transcript_33526/g.98787  ORF Transcript_33526/g.98787 Transcript_33526/m.98787 type:complete len:311 (+) Transcript_33526:251-1183(+)